MNSISDVNAFMPPPDPEMQRGKGIEDMNMDQFLKLMITELQSQDPLDPMDNTKLMEQLNQIRDMAGMDKLTGTLDSVLIGQNLSTASSLIGKTIHALSDDGRDVTGAVDRVSVEPDSDGARTVRIHIGDDAIDIKNIRAILPEML